MNDMKAILLGVVANIVSLALSKIAKRAFRLATKTLKAILQNYRKRKR